MNDPVSNEVAAAGAAAITTTDNDHNDEGGELLSIPFLMQHMKYRMATPTDILKCVAMEKSTYPPRVAASKNVLQYRHIMPPHISDVRSSKMKTTKMIRTLSLVSSAGRGYRAPCWPLLQVTTAYDLNPLNTTILDRY